MILHPSTHDELKALIETSEQPVLIDFFAEWCGPCKSISPVLEQLDTAIGDKLQIIKVDIDKLEDSAKTHGVRAIPTLLLMNEGAEVARHLGAGTKSIIEKFVTSNVVV